MVLSKVEAVMLEANEERMRDTKGRDIPDDSDLSGQRGEQVSACAKCGLPLYDGCVADTCPACRAGPPVHRRVCGISGCTRPARANGRCRQHLHGDPWFA